MVGNGVKSMMRNDRECKWVWENGVKVGESVGKWGIGVGCVGVGGVGVLHEKIKRKKMENLETTPHFERNLQLTWKSGKP